MSRTTTTPAGTMCPATEVGQHRANGLAPTPKIGPSMQEQNSRCARITASDVAVETVASGGTPSVLISTPLGYLSMSAVDALDIARVIRDATTARNGSITVHRPYVGPIKWKIRRNQLLRRDVFRRDHFRCVVCGFRPKRVPNASKYDGSTGVWGLEMDHIVPKSRGGEASHENLQTLCETCNRRKGDR